MDHSPSRVAVAYTAQEGSVAIGANSVILEGGEVVNMISKKCIKGIEIRIVINCLSF